MKENKLWFWNSSNRSLFITCRFQVEIARCREHIQLKILPSFQENGSNGAQVGQSPSTILASETLNSVSVVSEPVILPVWWMSVANFLGSSFIHTCSKPLFSRCFGQPASNGADSTHLSTIRSSVSQLDNEWP
jgi:hypothetical protein